jgi:DNA modification methylase
MISCLKALGWTGPYSGNKHPAPFPEQLAEDHILSWSKETDIVLDPMCGSGTTCKMAWLNKRNFIGIDISEEYINDICIPRLNTCGWQQDNNTLIKNVK